MSEVYQLRNVPTVAQYVDGLAAIRPWMSDAQLRLLQVQYGVADRTATAGQLAHLAGIQGGHSVVNSLYGRLGHAFCDQIGLEPELRPDFTHRWWSVWSRGWHTPAGFVWQMLPEVARALERLGWVAPSPFVTADEVRPTKVFVEGAVSRVPVNAYERNVEARRQCIAHYGANCCICGFDFGAVYGAAVEGYIHVHHLRLLSEIGGEYVVDPVLDLRPVCPNCHSVVHSRDPAYSVEEVRALLRQTGAR